jgi:hypothetical protein
LLTADRKAGSEPNLIRNQNAKGLLGNWRPFLLRFFAMLISNEKSCKIRSMPDDIPSDIHAMREELRIRAKRFFIFICFFFISLFLFVFYQLSQNGRYVLHEDGAHLIVFDTRTGVISLPKETPQN